MAIAILICPRLVQEYSQYAHDLLIHFFETAKCLYGPEFLVYNVHSLVHLKAVTDEHGSLDKSFAFVFENYLHKI